MPRGESRSRAVDLDAAAAETGAGGQAGALEQPRRSRGVADDPRALALPAIVAAVLDADQRRLRAAEVAPALPPRERVARLTTFQKKSFADRNIRLPPRSR